MFIYLPQTILMFFQSAVKDLCVSPIIENNLALRYDGGTKTEIDWEDPILSLTPP